MAELFHPALRVWIARRRYVLAGRKSLRNFDWEKGVWITPAKRTGRLPPWLFAGQMATGLAGLMLFSLSFDSMRHAANDLARSAAASKGLESQGCAPGNPLPLRFSSP